MAIQRSRIQRAAGRNILSRVPNKAKGITKANGIRGSGRAEDLEGMMPWIVSEFAGTSSIVLICCGGHDRQHDFSRTGRGGRDWETPSPHAAAADPSFRIRRGIRRHHLPQPQQRPGKARSLLVAPEHLLHRCSYPRGLGKCYFRFSQCSDWRACLEIACPFSEVRDLPASRFAAWLLPSCTR